MKQKLLLVLLAVVTCTLFGTQIVLANTTFDTTPSWNGSSTIQPYGNPFTSTYGETFIAPSDNVLNDFTFYINAPNGTTLSSKAYVYTWNGSLFGGGGGGATGSALYSSPSSIITVGNGSFQTVTITTGGTALNAGGQYVASLTISNPSDFAATNGQSSWGAILFQHVANDGGGGFVFYNNGNNPSLLNTTVWDNFSDFGDLAYKADFTKSAVPIPGAVWLLGSGVVGLLGLRRKFKG